MISPCLTTHSEKMTYLRDFVQRVESGETEKPLMIFGPGASGKSFCLQELVEISEIPIVVLQENNPRYFPGGPATQIRCAFLILSLGEVQDFHVAEYLNASIVEFKPDPAYSPVKH
jgi:hypothetical protein